MLTEPNHAKVKAEHCQRQALIYVRQSTLFQVRQHTGSTTRQYDLTRRAQELGWQPEQIKVIDVDQGHSGASAIDREGFQWLVAEVGLGRAGAVLSLEASRLARSCSDWYRLLEICALTNTLVIDEEAIYDPSQYNDRLLLGFKGAMSEAELHWLRQRMQGGTLAKAQQGQLRFHLPVGLAYNPAGQIVLDPDEQVQYLVRHIFQLFEQHGSAMAVLREFSREGLRFPRHDWRSGKGGELVWEPLQHGRILAVLHNPAYAGAYVFGRIKHSRLVSPDHSTISSHSHRLSQEQWPIMLENHHSGYITWEQYLANQARLDNNRTFQFEKHQGAAREGGALLQGIVLCGKCGRRMMVRYLQDGITPGYECNVAHLHFGINRCQSLRGDSVDQAVVAAFLQALQPAQLELALATLNQLESQAQEVERGWQLQLERAHYEVELARRRFMAVEPENRLVARSLERDWNERLAQLEALETQHAAVLKTRTFTVIDSQERERIMALAQDVPALWSASTTSQAERKQLLRFVIQDVTLTLTQSTIEIGIRWHSGALTQQSIARPLRSCDKYRTDPRIVERIQELAPDHCDQQIAQILNEEGWRTSRGERFSDNKVNCLRYSRKIATLYPSKPTDASVGQRRDGRYSTRAAAELLNVHSSTVAQWCQSGQLDGIRDTAKGSYWVRLDEEEIQRWRKPVRKYRQKERLAQNN